MNAALLSDRSLARFGDYAAVVAPSGTVTSVALHDRACHLAGALRELGVAPGDRVMLLMPDSAEMLTAFMATLRVGAVAVPLFSGLPASEIARLVAHCSPAAVLASRDVAAVVDAVSMGVRHRVVLGDGGVHPGWIDGERLATGTRGADPVSRAATDVAVLCYTSGSTGTPKGVVYSHASLLERAALESRRGEAASVLVSRPLSAGGAGMMVSRLAAKWTLVLPPAFDARTLLVTIARHRVTTVRLVPSTGEALLAVLEHDRYDLSSVRRVSITGAHVPGDLVERLAAVLPVRPSIVYGMTEAGGGITESTSGCAPGSVGMPLAGVEIRIVDDDGREVPRGTAGEVLVRTPWISAGYFDAPVETAVVLRDGWLRTGDRGWVGEDASLFLTGRLKDLINQGGVKVQPGAVVEVIRQLPDVAECAVVGVPHPVLGEAVVACVVRRAGASITHDAILTHCRAHLDARQLPVRVEWLEHLPHTHTGKIDRDALRRQLAAAPGDADTPLMRQLRAALPQQAARLLRQTIEQELRRVLQHTGRHVPEATLDSRASFGELGLTSIEAVRFGATLGQLLGRTLPATATFSHSRIGELADAIAALYLTRPAAARPSRATRPTATQGRTAIVGVACRLPGGADTPERFWELLTSGTGTTRAWPSARSGQPSGDGDDERVAEGAIPGSFLERVDLFDAQFFRLGTPPAAIDPQHRLFLETSWEALEDAGCASLADDGAVVGVFAGISGTDYPSDDRLGVSPSMAVARLCHACDFRGPALTLDTACSSSLVAVHAAVQSLRLGECDVALVAGVKVIATATRASDSQLGVLSADGRSKAFDAAADGYGRGEGCVAVVLKREADALADGNRLYAFIRGTAINHDGRSHTLTAPNPVAQEIVIQRALASAGVAASAVQYVETHGTGTLLGDPIEVHALAAAFAPRSAPLRIGSVKTNVGHLEAAAGITGLLKVVLALQHRELPASLHFETPNPHIAWDRIPIAVQRTTGAWPDASVPLVAGVSAFGLSGTNAHVVLEEAPHPPRAVAAPSDSPLVLTLTARSPEALRAAAEQYVAALSTATTAAARDIAYTASCRRAHFEHRLAVVGRDAGEWAEQLRAHLRGQGAQAGRATAPRQGLVMVFTGQGAQWPGMGRELLAREPVFRATVTDCAAAIDRHTSWRLLEELGRDAAETRLHETEIAQPAIFALQAGLVSLWRSWGIEPEAVVGHSLGEVTAAYVAGALSLDGAAYLAVRRGRLLQETTGLGRMLAVELSADDVQAMVGTLPGVEICAINGPSMTTLGGEPDVLGRAADLLRARGVRCTQLPVNYAFHTALVDAAARRLTEALAGWSNMKPAIPMMSTVTGDWLPTVDAQYWGAQVRRPVRFYEATRRFLDGGYDCFIEVGPHPVLLPAIAQTVQERRSSATLVGSIRRVGSERRSLAESLGALWTAGVPVDWRKLYPTNGTVVRLPGYPWQRRSYWIGPRPSASRPATSSMTAVDAAVTSDTSSENGVLGALKHMPREEGTRCLREHLRELVAASLERGLPERDDESALDALGFDSLLMLGLRRRLETDFGLVATAADIAGHHTLVDLAAWVEERLWGRAASTENRRRSQLVELPSVGRADPPLILVHPVGGGIDCYFPFARALGRQVLALEAVGLRGESSPLRDIGAMAARYVELVTARQPSGPYLLGGWSLGGCVAFEMARQLTARGLEVAQVVMIDSYFPSQDNADPSATRAAALRLFLVDVIGRRTRDPERLEAARAEVDALLRAVGEDADDRAVIAGLQRTTFLGGLRPEDTQRLLTVYRGHFDAHRSHRPGRYDGRVVLFRCTRNVPAQELDRRWHAVAGALDLEHVDADHYSIVQPPLVEQLAATVNLRLAAALRATAPAAPRRAARA